MDKAEIKYIDISFENCEVVRVVKKDIHQLYMSGITRQFSFTNGYGDTYCHENLIANYIMLSLKDPANTLDAYISDWGQTERPFDRIKKHNDVVCLHIHYEDDSEEETYAYWEGEDDYENRHQTYEWSDNMHRLKIIIDKDYVRGV